jgi:hypothetical protein
VLLRNAVFSIQGRAESARTSYAQILVTGLNACYESTELILGNAGLCVCLANIAHKLQIPTAPMNGTMARSSRRPCRMVAKSPYYRAPLGFDSGYVRPAS